MTISLSNINSMRTLAFATRIMEASRRSSRPLVVFKGTHTCESCWRGPSLNRISPIERLCAVGSTPAVERRATSKQRKHRSPPGEGFASLMFQCQESWALYRPLWLELCCVFLEEEVPSGDGQTASICQGFENRNPRHSL